LEVVLANNLRLYRERAGLSQAELARIAGVSRQTLSAIELGHQEPSMALAKILSSVLTEEIDKMFFRGESQVGSAEKSSLTKVERLMLSNQYRILAKLNADDDYQRRSFERIAEIFESGYVQMYRHAFEHISEQLSTEVTEEVLSILDMHRIMLLALGEKPDPRDVERVRFKGFDANNEGEYLSFAKFFCDGGRKYSELQIFNSHHSTLSRYRAMLREWQRMNREPDLTKAQIDSIVDAGQIGIKSKVQYYWGFRQVKLGTPLNNTSSPGRAVLNGPYASREEAERARQKEAGNWDATTSQVFVADSKQAAQYQVELVTPSR
jgi:uncharacterized protein